MTDEHDLMDQVRYRAIRLAEENERLKTENTALRVLLELFAADEAEPVFYQSDGWRCFLCDTLVKNVSMPIVFPHAPDCPWVKARAFLPEHPKEKEAGDGE